MVKARTDLDVLAFAGRQCIFDTGKGLHAGYLDDAEHPEIPGWNGPYIAESIPDPWGTPYGAFTYFNMDIPEAKIYYFSNGPNKIYEDRTGDDISIFVGTYTP